MKASFVGHVYIVRILVEAKAQINTQQEVHVGFDTLCSKLLCSQIVPIILMKLAYYSHVENIIFYCKQTQKYNRKHHFLLYCNITETVI